jgi:uncharacterized membrane-anchored protein YitT (DUF2179 family)
MLSVFKNRISPYIAISLGALLAAFAFDVILLPATILDSGINGISLILTQLTPVRISIYIIILNIPFLILGFKQIGYAFVAKAGYAMALFSVLLVVFEHLEPITHDEMLSVIFGGVLLGIGVGIIIRNGGCLDGSEIVAIICSKKTSLSVGQIMFVFNIVIYGIAGILLGWDRAMYSLVTYFITFKIIDYVEVGLDQCKAVMIITDDATNIANDIYCKLGRTATKISGQGMISGEKDVLYCVVTCIEIAEVKRIINNDDHSAFVSISDVSEIIGKHIKNVTI